jgi:hypothetical protein
MGAPREIKAMTRILVKDDDPLAAQKSARLDFGSDLE